MRNKSALLLKPTDAIFLPEPSVTNFFMRFFYSLLLCEFEPREVRDYFNRFSLMINDKRLSETETFAHLWNEREFTPQDYAFKVINNLESYFVSHEKSLFTVMKEFLCKMNVYNHHSYRYFTHSFLQSIQVNADFKKELLRHIHRLPQLIMPLSNVEIIKIENNLQNSCSAWYAIEPGWSFLSIATPLYAETAFIFLCQLLPMIFGDTPYHGYSVHSECISLADCLGPSFPIIKKHDRFYLHDEVIGKSDIFYEFLKRERLNCNGIAPIDSNVVVAQKDIFCPQRKRTVIWKNCAYGAPICVFSLHHKIQKGHKPYNARFPRQDDGFWQKLFDRHQQITNPSPITVRAWYDKIRQSLMINGMHITGGVQARLLREIIILYKNTGRTEFDWRELAADSSLICDPFSTGLTTRMKRIIQCLKKKCPFLSIEKYSRGKYRLAVSHPLEFRDI